MFFVGLGIGINRVRFAGTFADSYNSRVVSDGGITEGLTYLNSASDLLKSAKWVLIPSGYKEGKVYAEIPSDGNGDLSFSRSSDAWRTYSDGSVKRTAWNVIENSEDFGNLTYWTNFNIGITTNLIANPINSKVTADQISANTSSNVHAILRPNALSLGQYNLSVYVKAGTGSKVFIGNTSLGEGAFFNLANGTLEGTTGTAIGTIVPLSGGWYRITTTTTVTTSNTMGIGLYSSFTGVWSTTVVYTGSNEYIYIWGVQATEGFDTLPYLPTTNRQNVPRLSYKYAPAPALLLEPQRTNSIPNSLGSGTGYDTVGTVAVTTNFATAPDGTNTATRVNASAGVWRYRNNATTNLLANTTYTFSVWVKSNTSGNQTFRMYLYNATLSSDFTATTSWQRFTFTLISPSSVVQIHGLGGDTSNNAADILTWGWQIEAGSFPTTYIPTTSATATRVADTFSRNNIYTNGLISASGGTWYVELKNNVSYTRDGANRIYIGDTSGSFPNNGVGLLANSSGRIAIVKNIATVNTTLYTTTTDTVKIAIKWNGTTADIFENGTKVVSATVFTTTNMELLTTLGFGVPVFIQQMALFSTPLSDSQCTALTTINGYPTATEALSSISITPESSTCMNNTINTLVS